MKDGKPQIAILHYTALPIIGGVENVVAEHARLLVAAGYSVTLFAGRGGEPPPVAGAPVVALPELDSEHPANLRIAREIEAGRAPAEFETLEGQIEARLGTALAGADLLIAHNVLNYHFNLPLVAALHRLIDRGAAPKVVAWCHDISRYVNPASGARQRYGFPWDLMRTYRPEATYVAVSPRRREMLSETLHCAPAQVRVIPNGVAIETLWGLGELSRRVLKEADLVEADLVLLMPVRITRAKNIEAGLRVTAALKSAGIDARLVVTGPVDPHVPDTETYFRELLALRRQLAVERQAFFLHERNLRAAVSDVAELYRAADVVFMPSHREGFGLPILEGGLMGKAVFASDVPAVDAVGGDLVHRLAPDEPAEAVAARIGDWTTRDAGYRLSHRVRKQFTWSSIFAREIRPLIEGLL